MSADKSGPENQSNTVSLLYLLTVAFPSWAGAILAVYTVFLYRFNALKIRLK